MLIVCVACHKQTFDDRVADEVKHFNTTEAPKRLDPLTTFDSMSYDRDAQMLTYFYTMSKDVDVNLLPMEEFHHSLLNNLRNSLTLKAHKDHGISFHYVYFLEGSGKRVIDCSFDAEDYK